MPENSQETGDVQEQLMFAASGEPFKNPTAAKNALRQKKLPDDDYDIIEHEGGYAIRPKEKYTERYWWVTFQERSSTSELEDVELAVNGESLKFQRGKRTIVPGRFLECADNGTFRKFTQVPGKGRKKGALIKTFPYTRHEETDEATFKKLKRAGDRLTKELVRKYGPDFNPEDFEDDN